MHIIDQLKTVSLQTSKEVPDFIVKSTRGVALTAVLILTPFTINNFFQGWYLLGVLTLAILVLCSISAFFCFHGQYSLGINLFGVTPVFMLAIIVALDRLGMAGSYWPALGILAFYFILPETFAWIANIIFIVIIVPIGWMALDPSVAMRFFAVLIGVSVFSFLSIHEINNQHYLLKKLSNTDVLTGLHNRQLLQHSLENAIQLSHRTNTEMTLIMLDIDHFKNINDEFGHTIGDSVLRSLGGFLADYFRSVDIVFRVGGEEFIALTYGMDEANAMIFAEKLRDKIERLSLVPSHVVTVSAGVSSLQKGMDWMQWMKHCDSNLYKAKSNGRNQVVG